MIEPTFCVTHGNPQSIIKWQRRDGAQIQIGIGLNKELGKIIVNAGWVRAEQEGVAHGNPQPLISSHSVLLMAIPSKPLNGPPKIYMKKLPLSISAIGLGFPRRPLLLVSSAVLKIVLLWSGCQSGSPLAAGGRDAARPGRLRVRGRERSHGGRRNTTLGHHSPHCQL
jgi:hypothetical protein